MKQIHHIKLYTILIGFLIPQALCAGLFQAFLTNDRKSQPKEETSELERRLAVLKKTADGLKAKNEEITVFEQVAAELVALKQRVSNATNQSKSFWQKKLAVVSHLYQTLSEILQVKDQMRAIVEEHSAILQQPRSLEEKATRNRLGKKALPTFEDLQKAGKQVSELKNQIESLEKSKSTLVSDQGKRKKALDDISKEYDEKKAQHDAFRQEAKVPEEFQGFSKVQWGELVDEELRVLRYRKILAQLKIDEGIARLSLVETKLIDTQKLLHAQEAFYSDIKRGVEIELWQVKDAEAHLEKDRQDFFIQRDNLYTATRMLVPQLEEFRVQTAHILDKALAIAVDLTALQNWSFDVDRLKKASDWHDVCIAGAKLTYLSAVESKIRLYEAQIDQAKQELAQKELNVDIVRSWHRLTRRSMRLNMAEVFGQEKKKYSAISSSLKADIADFTGRRDKAIELLYQLNVTRDTVNALQKKLTDRKEQIFFNSTDLFQQTLDALLATSDNLNNRIAVTTKLMELYAKTLGILQDMLKSTQEISSELSEQAFWMRSGKSIDFQELKNFLPDVQRFFKDNSRVGASYWSRATLASFSTKIQSYWDDPSSGLLLLIKILIIIFIFFLFRTYLPRIENSLLRARSRYRFFSTLRAFVAVCLGFFHKHLFGLYLWSVIAVAINLFGMAPFFSILFYLLSIPYLLFIMHSFFAYFMQINTERGYQFVKQSFLHRFKIVVPTFCYLTLILMLFKQAFVLGNYFNSQVPAILSATIVILLQLAVIALISKDSLIGQSHVLWVFSRATPFGKWIEERINKYYYIFLLALTTIIIIMNPFVGYGRQVSYVLSRLFLTALLIPLFTWIYERLKRASSDFFFYYPDGLVVKERFAGGKTWYGFFVVASFLLFVFLGILIGARVWGQGWGWADIQGFLNHVLYPAGFNEVTGEPIQVTVMSIIKIVLYVLGGAGIVYIINRFVLQRIFDPLLVGSGVQSTIMTLSRYAIMILAFLLALQSVGLGAMATKISLIIGAVAYIIREPIGDFFSYFIILVQRPIKIGDYVECDDPIVSGVVRHITPRTTIIRHKNSVTYVVPNSTIVTKVLRNWHFSRSFCAFDDIIITVGYSANPDRVKTLITQTLEENQTILKNPAPLVWLVDFAENGYKFSIRGFISADRVMDKWEIESQIRFVVAKKLKAENIPFACPTRLVAVKQALDGQAFGIDSPCNKDSESK